MNISPGDMEILRRLIWENGQGGQGKPQEEEGVDVLRCRGALGLKSPLQGL